MTVVTATPFQEALEMIDSMTLDDQEALMEIVHRRFVDRRRGEIATNAQVTLQAFREGRASYGTVDDLRRELEA